MWGRERELRELEASFGRAVSGQGSLTMVVGEPGIGKTALCEQVATFVAMRSGRTLVGHCYEEGSLSLPYLPFVEALRTYVLAREPDGLKQDWAAAQPRWRGSSRRSATVSPSSCDRPATPRTIAGDCSRR